MSKACCVVFNCDQNMNSVCIYHPSVRLLINERPQRDWCTYAGIISANLVGELSEYISTSARKPDAGKTCVTVTRRTPDGNHFLCVNI